MPTSKIPRSRTAYDEYLDIRAKLYAGRKDKPVTLMDMATIGAKALKKAGLLKIPR